MLNRQTAEQKLNMLADDNDVPVSELVTTIYGDRTPAICSARLCSQMGWIPTGSELEIHECPRCGEAMITPDLLADIVAL